MKETMPLQALFDSSTNPNVAIPTATTGILANTLVGLPHFINIGMAIYVVLLVIHKFWRMYKEWKGDTSGPKSTD